MANRLSQEAVEALYGTTANARVSQEAVEALYKTAANARVSQQAVEVLIHVPHEARVSQQAVEVLVKVDHLQTLPFISSTTAVYPPTLQTQFTLPFIASATVVYAPTVIHLEVDVPFIASKTRVFRIFSIFVDQLFTGTGNGGEAFPVRLAPTGTSVTATLATPIDAAARLLELVGDSDLPVANPFCLTIDDEVVYVSPLGGGSYRIRGRAVSNTAAATHAAGASATWTDSYDMAIVAGALIASSFSADINSTGLQTYPGWLMCFDSSQAYLGGSRYPMHVGEVLGVFDARAGSTGPNRCDAAQPNAISTPAAASNDCPAALSNPSRIQTDIEPGDVAVLRYTNTEASVLDLGQRSVALQSWFGLKRVDATDHDVTFTDPAGHVIDTIPGTGPFTGSVNGEWLNPLGPGIGPDTGEPTPHDVPYTSVTLPGVDRYFTYGSPHYSEKGWPIGVLAVRQGNRRVPHWRSWDWHNFSYVYSGFAPDATFAQVVINRNGIVFDSVPNVELPGPQDIDGPDAVWDDGSYYFGVSWYVAIFATAYLVAGPSIGGVFPELGPGGGGGFTPVVSFAPGGGGGPPVPDVHVPFVEGGDGGDITPVSTGLHINQRF